jgi:hypothetical protein
MGTDKEPGMTKESLIEYLLSHGFDRNGDRFSKDILVVERNDKERRFEIFYDTGERTPVYFYDDFLGGFTVKVIDGFFSGLYDAIKTFDED